MDSSALAGLILHLGRIASGDGLLAGLTPAQWTGLRYFAQANRFSRTPSAFAAFHGTTRGTASQIIKALVADNYLTQTRSNTDGRSVRLDLTDKARTLLKEDPIEALVRAADRLPTEARHGFSAVLQRLLENVAMQTGKPVFGTCETCVHFEGDGCCQQDLSAYECGFVKEALTAEELTQICINFGSEGTRPARSEEVGS